MLADEANESGFTATSAEALVERRFVQDLTSDARGFLKRYHVNYIAVHDGGGSTYDGYGLTGVPETYWLDARGRIVAHYPGQISRRLLEQGIRQAARSR